MSKSKTRKGSFQQVVYNCEQLELANIRSFGGAFLQTHSLKSEVHENEVEFCYFIRIARKASVITESLRRGVKLFCETGFLKQVNEVKYSTHM